MDNNCVLTLCKNKSKNVFNIKAQYTVTNCKLHLIELIIYVLLYIIQIQTCLISINNFFLIIFKGISSSSTYFLFIQLAGNLFFFFFFLILFSYFHSVALFLLLTNLLVLKILSELRHRFTDSCKY